MSKLTRKFTGFTLIELLVTIAIIGVLASVFVASFPAAQRRARDAQRKNDLKQFQTAVEGYAARNDGYYPVLTGNGSALCTALSLTTCATDPKAGQNACSGKTCGYNYTSNSSGSEYVLYGAFEQQSTSQPYWEICGTGQTGEGGVVPTGGVCTVGSVSATPPPTSPPGTIGTPPPTSPPATIGTPSPTPR